MTLDSSVHKKSPHSHHATLQWRHNERNDVSNHLRLHCLLNRMFGRRSKKTSKLHRWIPLTKGQLHEKLFHLMTSSCINYMDKVLDKLFAYFKSKLFYRGPVTSNDVLKDKLIKKNKENKTTFAKTWRNVNKLVLYDDLCFFISTLIK